MALGVTALTALLAVACGSLHATSVDHPATSSVANCALTFEVVYPEDEGEDPYPICTNHCPAQDEVWFDGVVYKHFCALERYNMMIEANFKNGELQGCKMVPLLTVEEIKTRQEALKETLEKCLATKEEESTVSELGPVLDESSGLTRVGKAYFLIAPDAMSWQNGVTFCRQYGATIAIIESQEKQEELQGLLTSDVWIGLNDIAMEGNFKNPGRSEVKYTNWARQQPDNGNGNNEDCTMMVRSLGFAWVDASCDSERRVLCELLASPFESVVLPEGGSTDSYFTDNTTPELPKPLTTTTTEAPPPPTTTTKPTPPPTTTTKPPPPPPTTTRAPRYSCPAGSHMFQRSACFHVSQVKGDNSQAINYCAGRGMTLASIHSLDETFFVNGLLTASVWIGLYDRDHKRDFRWIDGTPLDYNHFYKGEPNNYENSFEWCVEKRDIYGYAWNDKPCDTSLGFLCRGAVSVQ